MLHWLRKFFRQSGKGKEEETVDLETGTTTTAETVESSSTRYSPLPPLNASTTSETDKGDDDFIDLERSRVIDALQKAEKTRQDIDPEGGELKLIEPPAPEDVSGKLATPTEETIKDHMRRALKDGMLSYWLLGAFCEIYGLAPSLAIRALAFAIPSTAYGLEKELCSRFPNIFPRFFSTKKYTAFNETTLVSFHLFKYLSELIKHLLDIGSSTDVITQTITLVFSAMLGGAKTLVTSEKDKKYTSKFFEMSDKILPSSEDKHDEENGIESEEREKLEDKKWWHTWGETCGKYTGLSWLSYNIKTKAKRWYRRQAPDRQYFLKQLAETTDEVGTSMGQINFMFEILQITSDKYLILRLPFLASAAFTSCISMIQSYHGNLLPLEAWRRFRTAFFDFWIFGAPVVKSINTAAGVGPKDPDNPYAVLAGIIVGSIAFIMEIIRKQISPEKKAELIEYHNELLSQLAEYESEKNNYQLRTKIANAITKIITKYKKELISAGIDEEELNEILNECRTTLKDIAQPLSKSCCFNLTCCTWRHQEKEEEITDYKQYRQQI